jgi:hypothetical protein
LAYPLAKAARAVRSQRQQIAAPTPNRIFAGKPVESGKSCGSDRQAEDFTVTEEDELRRRLPGRPAVLDPWTEIVAGVVADYVREMRTANKKLADQIEHLKRFQQLTDLYLRAPNKELRTIKNHISSLYQQVSELRRAAKSKVHK